ncbi:hypothetical protein BH10BAC5_BH10BAC5_27880 [soil metagenome]
MEPKNIPSAFNSNSSNFKKEIPTKSSSEIYREYLTGNVNPVDKNPMSLLSFDSEDIIYVENKCYIRFQEFCRSMIKDNWEPCSKVFIKTDKFYQEFKRKR